MIKNYNDFINELLKAGFSGAIGGKDDGVFGLFRYGWAGRSADAELLAYATEGVEEETGIHWHTGNPDTDPWEWRMRVLDERSDIAYSKVFFKKAGYITKEWYPYFLAARRGRKVFDDDYSDGKFSYISKCIYDVVAKNDSLPLHEIKHLAGIHKEDKSKFDGALTELQMMLYLTMRGKEQKVSSKGEEYGWASTVFCTTEHFWGEAVFEQASGICENDAVDKITKRILELNPFAQEKKIIKFIKG